MINEESMINFPPKNHKITKKQHRTGKEKRTSNRATRRVDFRRPLVPSNDENDFKLFSFVFSFGIFILMCLFIGVDKNLIPFLSVLTMVLTFPFLPQKQRSQIKERIFSRSTRNFLDFVGGFFKTRREERRTRRYESEGELEMRSPLLSI